MDEATLKYLLDIMVKREGIESFLEAVAEMRKIEHKDTVDFWEGYCRQERGIAWDAALKGEKTKEEFLNGTER